MTPADIKRMKESGILKLSKGQLFAHYAIVLFLLLVPIFTTYELIEIYVLKNYDGVRTPTELMVGYLWIIPAIAFYFIQKRRLKFTEINVQVSGDTFKKVAEDTAEKLKWTIENKTNDYIIAVRKSGFLTGGSWGELITIIRNKDRVLINSICNPDHIISVASYGWNKKNIKSFKERIQNLQ